MMLHSVTSQSPSATKAIKYEYNGCCKSELCLFLGVPQRFVSSPSKAKAQVTSETGLFLIPEYHSIKYKE